MTVIPLQTSIKNNVFQADRKNDYFQCKNFTPVNCREYNEEKGKTVTYLWGLPA